MTDHRRLGLVIGLATGPAGGFAQSWSGVGDGRLHVTLLMSLVGALLGALTLPVFADRPRAVASPDAAAPGAAADDARTLPLGFLALFGFAVAVVAGTFAAFPVGSSLGSAGGAVGGLAAGLVWRVRPLARSPLRVPIAGVVAAVAGWATIVLWVR